MASIKTHVYRGTDDGTESCDFRGEHFIGSDEGDHHRTIPQLEIDPANENLVELVLDHGPAINRIFSAMAAAQPDSISQMASMLGLDGDGDVGIRIGVWDN